MKTKGGCVILTDRVVVKKMRNFLDVILEWFFTRGQMLRQSDFKSRKLSSGLFGESSYPIITGPKLSNCLWIWIALPTLLRNKIDLITNAAKLTEDFFSHNSADHHYHPDNGGGFKKKPFLGRRRKRGRF